MADNTIIIGGATQPSTINTPSDKREQVDTFDKIFEIDKWYKNYYYFFTI